MMAFACKNSIGLELIDREPSSRMNKLHHANSKSAMHPFLSVRNPNPNPRVPPLRVKTKEEVEMVELMPYNGVKTSNASLLGIDEDERSIGILGFLKGKQFLITGATGFLAKVLIEKILRTAPDVGKIYVLIKAQDREAAMKRLKFEIINAELFKCLREIHGKNYQSFMQRKLVPVVGDIRKANLGIHQDLANEISEQVDVIVNSAANTTFDERYDVALDINTLGPSRLMSFAKSFKKLRLFLQVSTAYVNGQRQGKVLEKPFRLGETISSEINSSNNYENSKQTLDIDGEIKLGFRSLGRPFDASLEQKMKDLGSERAKMHGWQDTYVFTKAMGEMVINEMRGAIPVIVIRPSVIESTWKEPFPGWIEGNRMIDPVILSYGKGHLGGFLVDANGVIDVVPADTVANAMLAAMAKHGQGGSGGDPGMHVYQIASSMIKPLIFKDLVQHLYEHFSTWPYVDSKGRTIEVQMMKLFDHMDEFSAYILEDAMRRREFASIPHEKLSQRLKSMRIKSLEQAKYLATIYEPYTFYGGRFDNSNIQALMEEMSEEEMKLFGFDLNKIDWKDYIVNVHIPGLRKYVMKGRGMPSSTSQLM